MIPVYVPCSVCGGSCHVWVDEHHRGCASATSSRMVRCAACDGLGRQWAPDAPAYGCTITLADREPGEIVTLGNGQRARILWHLPYKRERGEPHTTFLGLIDGFFETESSDPVAYPSCIGVASVDEARARVAARDEQKAADPNDPMQRHAGALL